MIADAIRTVTAKVQAAVEDGYRSRMIDADDVVEILLAIADEVDRAAARRPNCWPPRGRSLKRGRTNGHQRRVESAPQAVESTR